MVGAEMPGPPSGVESTVGEQNVKAHSRVEIYAPTSGSSGVGEVAVTALLSDLKAVHPFLSAGRGG